MLATALERLSEASGREFPNLLTARRRTEAGLSERRQALSKLATDGDVAVVLMGSWGRAEVTSASDDDFMVLLRGDQRAEPRPSVDDVGAVLDNPPGDQGIFGAPVASRQLVENIGLEEDSNTNHSRRMLLLLESVPVAGDAVHARVVSEVVERYLDASVKDYRPPRFLLNDLVRYWRTICVDFAGKEHRGPEKWGIRNAKLRTSRKVLFAGGLLPVLGCAAFERGEMRRFLVTQLGLPPTDRIAESFLARGAADEGGRALGAYDDFLGLMDDQSFRMELSEVTRGTAKESSAFQDAARLGEDLERGLLALLFETDSLRNLTRDYLVF
ncbi:MAG: hypothetical protein GXY03_03560 [Solirubrobacterales bacterium]|nr:hypothetical protein [Solirubrobacterales bacterium]